MRTITREAATDVERLQRQVDYIIKHVVREVCRLCGLAECHLCECILNPMPETHPVGVEEIYDFETTKNKSHEWSTIISHKYSSSRKIVRDSIEIENVSQG